MKTQTALRSYRVHSLSSVLALLAALGLATGTALAGDDTKARKTGKAENVQKARKDKKAEVGEKILITGSNIPETVRPGKRIVTTSPVEIITRQQIERMGAVTAAGVLVRQASFR